MLKKELETAKELAAKAGNILLEHYQENPSVSWKGIDAPGAAADRAASGSLRMMSSLARPSCAIRLEHWR